MKAKGKFFAIGRREWDTACSIDIRAATAFLVQACGSQRNNEISTWGVQAIAKYGAMAESRAKLALDAMHVAGLSVPITPHRAGGRPAYRLSKPADPAALIWLPSSLVLGAGMESPLIQRFRRLDSIEALRTFVNLYGETDLLGDGGISRNLIVRRYTRERIVERSELTLWGFSSGSVDARAVGAFEHFNGRDQEFSHALHAFEKMGGIDEVVYLAESDKPDAELMHALSGDEHADEVADALRDLVDSMPDGYQRQAARYDFCVPIGNGPENANATLVGINRLTYRPQTKATSRWWKSHIEQCERYVDIYRSIVLFDREEFGAVIG